MTTDSGAVEVLRLRWSSDDEADQFAVANPATGKPLVVVHGAGEKEVGEAVETAAQAQVSWKVRPPRERARYLRQIADAVRAQGEEIARLESSDNGKPVRDALRYDVQACTEIFELFSGLCEAMPGQVRDEGSLLDITVLEPYGVVAAIVPFNWPPLHTAGKLAPALAVGNAVVLKPPEQAPLSMLKVVEIVQEILPDDVVHVVAGGGRVGACLAQHPGVDKISFTGAPATGSAVIRSAADNHTSTLMELGGKNPFIVCADADVDAAVTWAIEAAYYNKGEACTAASRLLVHRGVHDEFVEKLGRAVSRLRVGAGTDPATHIGPVVDDKQQRRVESYLEIGVQEGAVIAAQAGLPTDPDLAGGYFVRPTLFTQVNRDMRIANEEIFGPVSVVIPFESEEEAISIANSTDFGLVAAIFSRDSETPLRISRELGAGMIFVNNYSREFVGTPFGGIKSSGYGREHALETLHEFGYSKSMRMPSGRRPVPQWAAALEVTQEL